MTKNRIIISVAGLLFLSLLISGCQKPGITPEEARTISKEAFIYGFPMVEGYHVQYAYFVDRQSHEFKAPWNQLCNIARVFTSEDKAIVTPNSDTPYSMVGLDLRSEPYVITVPVIDSNRYFSIQLIDMYSYNFDYIGSRATGNKGGKFLIAGPGWNGETPQGVDKVYRSETVLVLAIYRTQLFNPADIENVKMVQSGYKIEPLSAFLGTAAPAPAPVIEFPKPKDKEELKTPAGFFNTLNFILSFCPVVPSETELFARFNKIGVGGGLSFDSNGFDPEVLQAIEQGMADGVTAYEELKKNKIDTGEITSGDLFGTREYLNNNYLYRMAAGKIGLYGNSKQEAMYPLYSVDDKGQKLDGSNKYTLHFAPGQLPPVNAFWSITMYELPASLLVANPINRYLVNSPMLPGLKPDADGGLTIHIQHDSPGTDLESNWLPAPTGPFFMAMRLYWPKDQALNGQWVAPPVSLVK